MLFADNEQFDAELRAAVREKWIAAWLYLRHLSISEGADKDDIQAELTGLVAWYCRRSVRRTIHGI